MKPKWLTLSRIVALLIIIVAIYHIWSDGTKINKMEQLRMQGIPRDIAMRQVHFICAPLNLLLIALFFLLCAAIIIEHRSQKKKTTITTPR